MKELFNTQNLIEGRVYKVDEIIDTIKVVIYICNSFFNNYKYRGKYILMKKFKFDISEIVSIPTILDKNNCETLKLSRFLTKYENDILNFIKVLEKKFSKDDLQLLYKNIKSLKMKVIDNMNLNGYYAPYENYVVIKKEKYKKTLPHELFHASTCKTLRNDSICGFHYLSKGLSIGIALNEGYTEIMANRYFNTDISFSAYGREINYYGILEDIIGTEEMEKLYMHADLAQLIKKLSEYKDENEVIEFITKTDNILRNDKESKSNKISSYDIIKRNDITNKIIEANLFLSSLYFQKNNIEDLTAKIQEYDDYSKLYKVNPSKQFKNIYIETLTLYNGKNKYKVASYHELKELYEIIGYDKLETICFKKGINAIIYELIKYTNLDEIYNYLELLDDYLNPFVPYSDEIYNKLEEFNFSLIVCKSGLLDDIQANINCGFNNSHLFMRYRNIIKECIKENKDFLGENDYFDYNDASRLYELVGKENMLRYYINGDIETFKSKIEKYEVDQIMHMIDSNNQSLKEYLEQIKENAVNKCK